MKYNIRYTSEYILKLQIHQHSLLTRKVFSWHNSSAQVFVTGTSSKMDHHQSWIITGSSSKLYRHWIIIIITAPDILRKWCYLSILLIIGSSTEPILFHDGCRPSLHVGIRLLLCLHMTMGGTNPLAMSERHNTHIWPWEAQPATMSETRNTYIWPWEA